MSSPRPAPSPAALRRPALLWALLVRGATAPALGTGAQHPARPWATRSANAGALASAFVALGLAVVIALAAAGCGRRADDGADPSATTPQASELPTFELRDDTPDLLLTWVDAQGDFHVSTRIADVPAHAREKVRVVQTTREAGTGRIFYVANLTAKQANGTYPVTTMTRAQWDELGAERRQKRLEALAPQASASAAPPKVTPGEVVVVIYGAEWCKPCHDAERFLKQRGANVKLHDIEKNDIARAELEQKLKRANLPPTAQIPIIDVGGHLLVGFSPSALDQALREAATAETL